MRMIGKKLFSGLLFAWGLSGCVGVSSDGMGYDVTVPLSVVNTTVAQNFPKKQQTNYGTLLIDKPNILGKQGSNKLSVGTSFSFSNMLLPSGLKGEVSFSSGIRYNAQNRGLYLASPMIDELKFEKFALSQYLTPEMRNLIGDVITQELMKRPIYQMNNLGASLVRGVRVKQGELVVTVGL